MINQHMIDILQSHSLSQMVIEPTRGSNILNIVLTTTPGFITTSVYDRFDDHEIVISNLDRKAKIVKKKPRKVFIHRPDGLKNIKEDTATGWEGFKKSNSVEGKWIVVFKKLVTYFV